MNREQLTKALMKADADGDAAGAAVIAKKIRELDLAPKGSFEGGVISQGATGFNEGLAGMLGLPADLAQGAINLGISGVNSATGSDIGKLNDSAFTSAWIRSMLDKGGMISRPSQDTSGQVARRVGNELGAAVPLAGGVLARGGQILRGGPVNQINQGTLRGQMSNTAVTAAKDPAKFVAADAGVSAAAGTGAATANQIAPDSQVADMAGAIAGGLTPLAATSTALRSPAMRAYEKVANAAAQMSPADVAARTQSLGPEAMVVDVLGAPGASLGRGAANINSQARESLESAINARKAYQNERVVRDINQAAGTDPSLMQSVDDMKGAALAERRPAITRAYEQARAQGADLPRTPFQDILQSPLGARAYDQAAESLKNRVAVDGMSANSELARLDETKRILDSIASSAYRSGDNNLGGQAADLSKVLRERLDQSIAGPAYSEARRLRKEAYDVDAAIDLGADLARPTVPINTPNKARQVVGANAERQGNIAAGYASRKTQELLNKASKPGDLSKMGTPLGTDAYRAALGPRADIVDNALARERIYNTTDRELTGNSTTARQLNDNLLSDVAGGAMSIADAKTGAIGTLARPLARAATLGIPARRARAEAPFIAEYLTQQGLPSDLQQQVLDRILRDDLLTQTLLGRQVADK